MMPLSISIITVPERIEMADKLRDILLTGSVQMNPSIFIDIRYQGVWWNAKRAWSDVKAPYHMVIQDDCLPNFPATFLERLLPIINILNDKYICTLFDVSNPNIRNSVIKGNRGLLEINRVTEAQAIIMSRTNIFRFLKWVDEYIPYDNIERNCDDERIAAWQIQNKIPALLPMPYMVSHQCGTKTSTIGNKHAKRKNVLPDDDGSEYPMLIYKSPHKVLPGLRFKRSIEDAVAAETKHRQEQNP